MASYIKLITPTAHYLEFIEVCLKAGITCVQLREKSLPGEDLLDFGNSLQSLLDLYKVHSIVNDEIDLCIKLSAFGPDKIIGLSVNTIEQIQNSLTLPIDYIGVGAIFPYP